MENADRASERAYAAVTFLKIHRQPTPRKCKCFTDIRLTIWAHLRVMAVQVSTEQCVSVRCGVNWTRILKSVTQAVFLFQLGSVFNHITKERRQQLVTSVFPWSAARQSCLHAILATHPSSGIDRP